MALPMPRKGLTALQSIFALEWSLVKHVAGTNNPADLASRGTSAEILISSPLWLHGPDFLAESSTSWPRDIDGEATIDLERRAIVSNVTNCSPIEWSLLCRYSKLIRLLRVTARCQQFLRRLKLAVNAKKLPLTTTEITLQQSNELRISSTRR